MEVAFGTQNGTAEGEESNFTNVKPPMTCVACGGELRHIPNRRNVSCSRCMSVHTFVDVSKEEADRLRSRGVFVKVKDNPRSKKDGKIYSAFNSTGRRHRGEPPPRLRSEARHQFV